MKRVLVNIAELPSFYLKYIYPNIEVDTVSDIVLLTGEGKGRGFELELIQDRAGFPIYQKDGVIAMLRDLQLLPEAKLSKLENPGLTDVAQVYRSVATLRVANQLVREEESSFGFVLDFLKKPLDARVQYVLDSGTPQLLTGIIGVLAKALDKEVLKYQNKFYIVKLSEMLMTFKRIEFKENFELTSSWQEDLVHLQFYFQER